MRVRTGARQTCPRHHRPSAPSLPVRDAPTRAVHRLDPPVCAAPLLRWARCASRAAGCSFINGSPRAWGTASRAACCTVVITTTAIAAVTTTATAAVTATASSSSSSSAFWRCRSGRLLTLLTLLLTPLTLLDWASLMSGLCSGGDGGGGGGGDGGSGGGGDGCNGGGGDDHCAAGCSGCRPPGSWRTVNEGATRSP